MSLIADALKTAQRERERRASEDSPVPAAVLIPLREPDTQFSPKRSVGLVGVGVLLVAAALIVPEPGSKGREPLEPLPTLTSTLLSEAIVDDSMRGTRPVETSRFETAKHPSTRRDARHAVRSAPPPPAIQASPTAVLQGQPDSAQAAIASSAPGELRIAVESPPNADRLFSQAVGAHRSGDVEGARKLYHRVLAIDPAHPDALNNLAVIFSGEREFDRAIDMLRRAAALAPGNASTWNNIGTALREQGKSSEAIAAFRRALSVDPRHLGARVGLAQQYLAISALNESRELLEQVLDADPRLAEAHYTLGQVLERQGDRAGATQAYTTFVTIAPPHLASHVERVRLYLEGLSR